MTCVDQLRPLYEVTESLLEERTVKMTCEAAEGMRDVVGLKVRVVHAVECRTTRHGEVASRTMDRGWWMEERGEERAGRWVAGRGAGLGVMLMLLGGQDDASAQRDSASAKKSPDPGWPQLQNAPSRSVLD